MAEDGRIGFSASLDNDALLASVEEARGAFADLSRSASEEGSRIDSVMRKVGTAIGGYFSIRAAINFVKQITAVRGEIESLEVSFKTLLGDEQKAVDMMGELRQFASSTPMQLGDLASGAQLLLAFNVEAEKVVPTLRAIGDISMGDAQRFQGLTLAFSQMSSAGRLMGQDLMQMVNAGFNPLSQISLKTGKSISELKDAMSKGAISADMVAEAFMEATAEGGKFHGMLDKQSQSIKGSLSNLQSAVSDVMNELGESIQTPVTAGIQAVQKLVQNYETVGKVVATLVATYGGYKAAVMAVNVAHAVGTQVTRGYTIAQQLEYTWLLLVEKAQRTLNKTILKNPYAIAAAAIVGLVSALVLFKKRASDAEQAQNAMNRAVQECSDRQNTLREETDKLVQTLDDETATEYEHYKALEQLRKMYPALLSDVETYNEYLEHRKAILEGMPKEQEDIETDAQRDAVAKMKSDYEEILRLREQYRRSSNASASSYEATAYNNAWQQYQEAAKEAGYKGIFGANDKDVIDYLKTQLDANERLLRERTEKIREADWAAKPIEQKIEITEDSIRMAEARLAEAKAKATGKPWSTTFDLDVTLAQQAIDQLKSQLTELETQRVGEDKRTVADIRKEVVRAEKALAEARRVYRQDANSSNRAKVDEAEAARDKAKADYKAATGKDYDQSSKDYKERQKRQRELNEAEREAQREYAEWRVEQAYQTQVDIRQAEISGMKDGLQKTLAQIDLDYDKEMHAIEEREHDMLEAIRDLKEAEWNAANPTKVSKGEKFDRETVTTADLTDEDVQQLGAYRDIAAEKRRRAEKEAFDASLSDIQTYEQQRQKILEEYHRKEEALYDHDDTGARTTLRQGVGQGNLEELNRQQTETLDALDEQFAQRSETYQAWCTAISTYTLEQLEYVLEQAQEELQHAQKSGVGGEKLAVAQAKVTKAQQQLRRKKADEGIAPTNKSLQSWMDLYDAIKEADGALNDILDSVAELCGDSTADVIKMTSQILTSSMTVINGIVTLTESASAAMTGTATVAATAIKTVETASVILTVISAALSIATAIANTVKNINARRHEALLDSLTDRVDALSDAYDYLGQQASKTFGETNAELLRQQILLRQAQIELLNTAIAEERAQKKPDTDKIQEWQDQINEINNEIADLGESAVDAIFGEDISSAIENFADAMTDAWENGTNAATNAKDVVRQMMRQMVQESIKDYLQSSYIIERIRQQLQDFWSDGVFTNEEIAEIERLAEEAQQAIEDQFGWAESLFDDTDREGSKKGIATASQESVDELNGRMTAVQGHTFSISENTAIIRDNVAAILGSVRRIESNTEELHSIRTAINDIQIQGVRIKT